jgi:uncharacterized protein involved in outer membrane biogenesis
MTPAQRIGFGVVTLVLVAGVVSVFLFRSSLDGLVKKAMERYGSEVTDTRVSVASVSLALRGGRATVGGIAVANPEGFTGDDAFRLGRLVVDLDVKSVTRDPIVIEEIRVEAPRIVVEALPDGRVNLDILGKSAKSYRSSSAPEEKGASRRLRIHTLVFEPGEMILDLRALGKDKVTAELAGFRLTNLGGAGGAEPGEIGQEVVRALARKGLSAAARQGLDEELKQTLGEKAGEAAQELIDDVFH